MTEGRGSVHIRPDAADADRLLGTWALAGFETLVDGDVVGNPLGPSPIGQLTYQPGSRMSAVLMRRDRAWPSEVSFLAATDDVRGRAAAGFSAYAGTFDVKGDVVRHHVEMSLFPERVGTQLVRTISWCGSNLILSTPVLTTRSGRSRWDRLEWHPAVD